MKKEDAVSLLVYALMIVIAVLVGILVISPTFSNFFPGQASNMGFAFLFVIVAIVFNVLFLELAHVIGAKTGGYGIISFNVLGFCFYRKGEKWGFKFSNFDGLTGETKIAPKKEKLNPRIFPIMPLIFYALEIALLMVLYSVLLPMRADNKSLGYILILFIMFVTIGGMLELYNIFPAHLDSTTDGYRLIILAKKDNLEAYNELMRIEDAYARKIELTDMKIFDKITDFTAQVNLYSVYKYLKENNIDEAEKILDLLIENKARVHNSTYCSSLAQKMYIMLMHRSFDDARAYYEKNVTPEDRRFISNDLSMESIRAYILISSMLDISEHETRYAISRVKKAEKRCLAGRIEIEKQLFDNALNKVDLVRPEWHIKEKEIN